MVRTSRNQARRRPARPTFRPEGLEARHLCSVGDLPGLGAVTSVLVAPGAAPGVGTPGALTVVSVVPAAGQVLAASPTRIILTFNEPLQPTSVIGASLALLQLADDGTATPVLVPTEVALDRTGTRLIETLPAGSLAAGHYRLILPDSAFLLGADGAAPAPGATTLGDFTVAPAPPGPSLADAIDLGVLGQPAKTVNGTLDLLNNPGGAALYKFTLPAGQGWTLGAAVDARGGGDVAGSVLALFDSAGRPLATAQPGATAGPSLSTALAPGTYYVGVSGVGNVPGTPGGYDPAAALAGTAPPAGSVGPFRLRLTAAVDRPATLQSLTVDRADPRDPAPTGLTLQFTGALNLAGNGAAPRGLAVVDGSGRSWPLVTSDVGQGGALLSFQFLDHLAPGHYTVILPTAAGLADSAGVAPVAPGQPAGVLGAFDVAAAPPRAAGDFGVITPGDGLAGIVAVADVAPGASTTFRFVVESRDVYKTQILYTGGALSMSLAGLGGKAYPLEPSPAGARTETPIFFRPGVYVLTLTAGGAQAVHVELKIQLAGANTAPELILPNGVGQTPAADLKLTAPATPTGSPATAGPVAPAPAPVASGVGAGALALAASGSALTPNTPQSAAGPALFLTPGGEAVGRPAAAIGRGESIWQGGGADLTFRDPSAAITSGDDGAIAAPDARVDGAIVAIAAPGPIGPRGTALDAEAEGPGWMDRLRQSLAAMMPLRAPESPAPELAAEPPARPGATAEVGPAEARGEAEVEQAGMGPNLGIGLVAALAAHVVRVIRRRQTRGRALPGPRATGSGRIA